MINIWCRRIALLLALVPLSAVADELGKPMLDAKALVTGALELTRGDSSYSELTMQIQRPGWQKTLKMVAWTRGTEDALIRFTAPAKDAGQATLKKGDQMGTCIPKFKKSMRLPSSMMSNSWGESDFSYNDLSRSDSLLRYYDLSVVEVEEKDDHKIYTLDAIPHDDAPVVWGKERMVMRDDYILLSQTYFDQDLKPIKSMETLEITQMGGRTIPRRMRMSDFENPGEWTEIIYEAADFDAKLQDSKFTLFSLQSNR